MFQRSRPLCRLSLLHKHLAAATTTLPRHSAMQSSTDKPATWDSRRSFQLFSKLPPELQLQIWNEAASPGPSMHIFDLCFPSSYSPSDNSLSEEDRGSRAFGTLWRYMELEDVAFLDARGSGEESYLVAHDPNKDRSSREEKQLTVSDPSMYRWRMALRQTCVDASGATALPSDPDKINTVILPGIGNNVSYDNSVDVLYLRLPHDASPPSATSPVVNVGNLEAEKAAGNSQAPPSAKMSTLVNGLINHPWSRDMTTTIQTARRVALDLTSSAISSSIEPTDGELIMQTDSAAFLACALHHNLEHLYLVVNKPKNSESLRARDLQTKGSLFQEMGSSREGGPWAMQREADVISGVGVTYREVFDYEGLGWDMKNPVYVLARIMDEAVMAMQRDSLQPDLVFKGVRILLEEEDL